MFIAMDRSDRGEPVTIGTKENRDKKSFRWVTGRQRAQLDRVTLRHSGSAQTGDARNLIPEMYPTRASQATRSPRAMCDTYGT